MKVSHAKSIKEAVDSLETFFEVDLYSSFRPETKIKGKKWYRQDYFKNKHDFIVYLRTHFGILEKEIKRLIGAKKYSFKKQNQRKKTK